MKAYRIDPDGYSTMIHEIPVASKTDETIVIQGRTPNAGTERVRRKSRFAEYYDTWHEARARLIEINEQRLAQLQRAADEVENRLDVLGALWREPSGEGAGDEAPSP